MRKRRSHFPSVPLLQFTATETHRIIWLTQTSLSYFIKTESSLYKKEIQIIVTHLCAEVLCLLHYWEVLTTLVFKCIFQASSFLFYFSAISVISLQSPKSIITPGRILTCTFKFGFHISILKTFFYSLWGYFLNNDSFTEVKKTEIG